MERIRDTYHVIELNTLKVDEIVAANKSSKARKQRNLIVLASLDGITEESNLCNLKLFAYKCSDAYKGEPASNFYLNADNFYAH